MRKVTNVVLAVCAVALLYMCYASIMGPIDFENEKARRDQAVIARLVEIKEAQLEYRKQYGQYTNNFDSLINFIKTGHLQSVVKIGELNDAQREAGITEEKAVAMINKAKKTGDWKEVEKNGLTNFKRDTLQVPVLSTLYFEGYVADSIKYVPFTNGKLFDLAAKVDTLQSGPARFFQAQTPYYVYLEGLDKQEIDNLIYVRQQLDRYPGIRVGSMEEPITTGNWEAL